MPDEEIRKVLLDFLWKYSYSAFNDDEFEEGGEYDACDYPEFLADKLMSRFDLRPKD